MKTTIRKIIIVAAVFFAAENAAADGYYIRNGDAGIYTASGYPNATRAEDAATEECMRGGVRNKAACDALTSRGSFEDQVVGWQADLGVFVRDNRTAVVDEFVERCMAGSRSKQACRNLLLNVLVTEYCGDGREEDLTDDCDMRFEAPTCPANAPYFDSTAIAADQCRLPTDDSGNGNTECMSVYSDAQPIFDESQSDNCRPRESNADCPTTAPYFDSAETDPANECRLPTENGECLSVFGDAQPIFADGETDKCRPRSDNADCPATAPYFDSAETDLANQCRLPTDENGNGDMECMDLYGDAQPIFADGETDKCRPRTDNMDCPADAPYFDSAATDPANECRLPTDESGNGDAECMDLYGDAQPIFADGETDKCRPAANTDCETTEFYNEAKTPPTCDRRTTANNDCIGGQTVVANLCENPVCESYEMFNDSAKTCNDRMAADCGDGEVFSPENTGGICQTPETFFAANTITVAATYTADSCESAGWISSITINSEKTAAAEVCGIPLMRDDSLAAAAAEFAPLQFSGTADGCVIRQSADFTSMPDCNDPQLFGEIGGFPQMPADFNVANDRLIVAVNPDGNRYFYNSEEVFVFVPAIASGNDNATEIAIFGAVGLGMAAFAIADFIYDGRPADVFAFSPDFGYSITESGYFVRAGGKIEYAASENLRMHWSAGQTNTGGEFGDFRYLSEAKYKADFWTATFSESVAGKTADYDLSLSANLQNGIWKISPIFRMHSEWKEKDAGIETETQNELNLEGEFRYNRWTISPSAGFGWQNFGEFADNGKFQINAIHRF